MTDYLVQTANPASNPAQNNLQGHDTYVIVAGSAADALAFVQNYQQKKLWATITPVALAAATTMNKWTMRMRLYNAASPAALVGDVTVENDGLAINNVLAKQTLVSSANYSNAETITIGTKVYTLQSSLTNVDGNIKIGASEVLTMTNIVNAINLGAGVVGTDYATAMTKNTQVTAASDGVHTVTATAIYGAMTAAVANAVATTETSATAAWGNTTLLGGVDTTDLPSSLGARMAQAIIAAKLGLAGASWTDSTHVLQIGSVADNKGNYTFILDVTPPARDGDYNSLQAMKLSAGPASNSGVPVQRGVAVPGMVTATTMTGIAGAVLTATLATDAVVVPTRIVAARSWDRS